MNKIAVLVSGGVDSSVALHLLCDQGYEIVAYYLKIWLEDEVSTLGVCPWEEDLSYAQRVCEMIGVPLRVISLQREYWDHVVAYTIAEIRTGRTPNPDIFCNKLIKFDFFWKKLSERGDASYDAVATGHYADVIFRDNSYQLICSPDTVKDQTYFLSHLNQSQLQRIIFPLGKLNKSEVRALASTFSLPNKDRKDSQGICFLGKLKFSEFVEHYLGKKRGRLVEIETDEVVGIHDGFWFYTVGQRKGLGLAGGPWYVVKKDPSTNTVYISRSYYSPDKERSDFIAGSCHWVSGKKPDKQNLRVKLRHGPSFYNAEVSFLSDDRTKVILSERDQGIAPGQFAVFYDDAVCLGAGVIEE